MKKILNIFLIVFFSFGILNCGEPKEFKNRLTIDSYGDNFSGYYLIDGVFAGKFIGNLREFNDTSSYYFYFYEKELYKFNSIKVLIFKKSEKTSLTASIWINYKEVATVSSAEYDGYDEETHTYKLAVDPLYYEWEEVVIPDTELPDDTDNDSPLY